MSGLNGNGTQVTRKERVFKIRDERGRQLQPIPLCVIAPHERTAMRNHNQTLLQLNHRGGLTPKEALHVLLDLPMSSSTESQLIQNATTGEADRHLRDLVRTMYRSIRAAEDAQQCDHPKEPPTDIFHGVGRCPKCGQMIALTKDDEERKE